MADPKTFHFKLPPYSGDPISEPENLWYPGVGAHHAATSSDRRARSDGRVRAFVIHATAGASSASAMSVMFAHRASWHWLVPGVEEPEHGRLVWACTPERRAAWHVRNLTSHPEVNGGKQYVNYWSLGLEIVNRQEGDAFSDWQVEQAGALVRYAWSKYPELREVVSHAKLDPGRRSDPGAHFPWSRFRELVLAPATPAAVTPVRVLGPDGRRIECDARLLDGASVAEIRALVEPLGYSVEYEEGPPLTARITASGKASAKRVAASRRKRARAGGKR